MKVNNDKSDLLMSGNKIIANIDNRIESEDINKLHGIIVDSKLTFENSFNRLCSLFNSRRQSAIADVNANVV